MNRPRSPSRPQPAPKLVQTVAKAPATTYEAVLADIRAGRTQGNGARNIKRSKYGNHHCEIEVDGKLEKFDSKAERDRYLMLRILERAGGIKKLRRQEPISLRVMGEVVARMRWDFFYTEGNVVVLDDYKGAPPTAEWRLKAKLCKALRPDIELRINGVRMK